MMQPIKSKGRMTLPKIRPRKHSKDETHDTTETNECQPSSHHQHRHNHDHHHHHSNPLFLLTKMKNKLQQRPKKENSDSDPPCKALAHSDSKLREVFTRFDADNDGQVDPWDLGSLIRGLGGNPTQAELDKITTKEKLYGPMDFDRFVYLVGKYFLGEMNPGKEVQRAFEVLDSNADGYVAVSDLKMLLTTSGEKLDSSEFDQWIQEVAVGPDGTVRYEDVVKTL